MELYDISQIKSNHLVSAAQPIHLHIQVHSAYPAKVLCEIKHVIPNSNPVTLANVELLCYNTSGQDQYFTADISKIVYSLFGNLDDDTDQSVDTWIECPDNLNDIRLVYTAVNGVDTSQTLTSNFTAFLFASQYGENEVKTQNVLGSFEFDGNRTYYAGAGNICYIYQLMPAIGDVDTYPQQPVSVLTDSNEEESILTDHDDTNFTE